MTIILPDSIQRLVDAVPKAPKRQDPSQWFLWSVAFSVVGFVVEQSVPALRGVIVWRALLGVAMVFALVGAVAWLVFGKQFKERNERQHREYLSSLDRYFETYNPHLRKAIMKLPRKDFQGQHCLYSPVGNNEHVLESALARHGFDISRLTPVSTAQIVPQYELLELGWKRWTATNGGSRNYVADFAYIDPTTGVKVDVEVDEDYHRGKQSQKDDSRNKTFISRGWVVLRFLEDDVKDQPDLCADIVAKTVTALTKSDLQLLHWVCERMASRSRETRSIVKPSRPKRTATKRRRAKGLGLRDEFDIARLTAGLALVGMMWWQLGPKPTVGSTATANKPSQYDVRLSGLQGLHFEGDVRVPGSPPRLIAGTLPARFPLTTPKRQTVTVNVRKKDPFGELRVELVRDGKVIQKRSTTAQFGRVILSGM